MKIYSSHEVDGIQFYVAMTFDPNAVPQSLIGGVMKAYAKRPQSNQVYAATVVILSALRASCVFPSVMPFGDYEVEVVFTPSGMSTQTVVDVSWVIQKSLGPA